MNDLQKRIVKAVSTILFEPLHVGYEEESISYRGRDECVIITPEKGNEYGYNLSAKKIDDKYCFEIWGVKHEEDYDGEITMVFGYVPFITGRMAYVFIDDYCCIIESIIENS